MLLSFRPAARAQDVLTVAAAADLSGVVTDLTSGFERQAGGKLRVSLGASGNLFHQIENGAPYDVFLSADLDYPRRLVAEHLADAASLRTYAVGRLVLWAPKGSQLHPEDRGIEVLLDAAVKKIAIANPEHAPYGRAAVAALRHYGLYDKVAGRLVMGENVSQAAQFVASGNAQAGLLALAQALAPGMRDKGAYWMLSPDSYPRLGQGAVILSRSPHKQLAWQFVNFLQSPSASKILSRYGFAQPEGAP